jgi:hypothetical protein
MFKTLIYAYFLCTNVLLCESYVPVSTSGHAISKPASSLSTNPFYREGLDIELPDFETMFAKIAQASPLARSVIEGMNGNRGLAAVNQCKNEIVLIPLSLHHNIC